MAIESSKSLVGLPCKRENFYQFIFKIKIALIRATAHKAIWQVLMAIGSSTTNSSKSICLYQTKKSPQRVMACPGKNVSE